MKKEPYGLLPLRLRVVFTGGEGEQFSTLRVELCYNAGHPRVPEPHYHVILWYVPEAQEPK